MFQANTELVNKLLFLLLGIPTVGFSEPDVNKYTCSQSYIRVPHLSPYIGVHETTTTKMQSSPLKWRLSVFKQEFLLTWRDTIARIWSHTVLFIVALQCIFSSFVTDIVFSLSIICKQHRIWIFSWRLAISQRTKCLEQIACFGVALHSAPFGHRISHSLWRLLSFFPENLFHPFTSCVTSGRWKWFTVRYTTNKTDHCHWFSGDSVRSNHVCLYCVICLARSMPGPARMSMGEFIVTAFTVGKINKEI